MTQPIETPIKPKVQDVALPIAGEIYTLRFSLTAMMCLQDKWGLDDDQAVAEKMRTGGLKEMVTTLWAMLQSHHPETEPGGINEKTLYKMLDKEGFEGIQDLIIKVLDADTAPVTEDQKKSS